MTTTTKTDAAIEAAAKLGREHGRNAADWFFDGNTKQATYSYFLDGMDEGDPEVLDKLPGPDLSGEWADGMTPKRLMEECDLDPDDDADLTDEICTAYEEAFDSTCHAEIERTCHQQLGWH